MLSTLHDETREYGVLVVNVKSTTTFRDLHFCDLVCAIIMKPHVYRKGVYVTFPGSQHGTWNQHQNTY